MLEISNDTQTSGELQKISLATFLRDPYIYSKVATIIDREFFNKYSYKLIYLCLHKYYTKYSKIPSKDEMVVLLRQEFNYEIETPIENVITDLLDLYSSDQYEEDFVVDQVQRFLKRSITERTLFNSLSGKKSNQVALESLADNIKNQVESVEIPKRREYKLGDLDRVKEVREKAVGTADLSRRIKSFLPGLNQALTFSAYKPGDLVMIVSPPGCFTGDTLVCTLTGVCYPIEQLYKSRLSIPFDVYQYNNGVVKFGKYETVNLTKYTKELVEVTLDNDYKIKCTPDHQFMINDGSYKQAKDLSKDEPLMTYKSDHEYKVKSIVELHLDKEVPVYDIINTKYHNFAISAGESDYGIFVHNCGKTMFMVNELSNAAVAGCNVLHMFLGDMNDYDALVRYTSRNGNRAQDELVDMEVDDLKKAITQANSANGVMNRIFVESFSADEITISELLTEVKRIQKEHDVHLDMIAVDYADNLKQPYESTYMSGGDIYNKLSAFANNNGSVVIVGSQPKQSYWNEEIIPKNSAADSSKKQHVVDIMLTFGLVSHGSSYGSMNLAKVRRGTSGLILRIKTDYENARMEQIPESEYLSNRGSVD